MSPDIFYGKQGKDVNSLKPLKDFVTIYTNGEININTAPEEVLTALFDSEYESLPGKINIYRAGQDGNIGTKDDRWFSMGAYILERGKEGMVEVKNLEEIIVNPVVWGDGNICLTEEQQGLVFSR